MGNAFGILANTWRVFHSPLECHVELSIKIIKATTVLHNYLHQMPMQGPTNSTGEEHLQCNDFVAPSAADRTNSTKEALAICNKWSRES